MGCIKVEDSVFFLSTETRGQGIVCHSHVITMNKLLKSTNDLFTVKFDVLMRAWTWLLFCLLSACVCSNSLGHPTWKASHHSPAPQVRAGKDPPTPYMLIIRCNVCVYKWMHVVSTFPITPTLQKEASGEERVIKRRMPSPKLKLPWDTQKAGIVRGCPLNVWLTLRFQYFDRPRIIQACCL